jgi:hypothetical protein
MITRFTTAALVALFFAPALPLFAQEHPEHPTNAGKQTAVTTAAISAGIKKHIATETKKSNDGKFHVKYQGKDLSLDLVRVHEERLASLGGGEYFACVDMKAADGTLYDIDFFLNGKPEDMKVTSTSVHKINGKALYHWKKEGNVWKKVSA